MNGWVDGCQSIIHPSIHPTIPSCCRLWRLKSGISAIAALALSAGCLWPAAWRLPPPPSTAIEPAPGGAALLVPPLPPAPPPEAQAAPLELDVKNAILTALENNPALKVERLNPQITRTFEDEERAAFDPLLSGQLSAGRTKSQRLNPTGGGNLTSSVNTLSGRLGVQQFLPTGTTAEATANSTLTDSSINVNKFAATRLGLSVTQALLRGGSVAANLASLRQARLDTLASHYELRGFAENLVADVERAYWDCVLAERRIEINTSSLKVAQQQLAETQERVKIGKLAERTELAAVEAEVASRLEALIQARGELATARLRLLRLLNPAGAAFWTRGLALKALAETPSDVLDPVEAHVQLALKMRPDLNEARVRIQRGDLELVKTHNGLLPKLDLFMALGKSGFGDSFRRSARELDGEAYDALAGVSYEFPLGNRAARARHERAALTRQQLDEALANLASLVQLDVRSAYIEVERAREQVTATAATRKAREVFYAAESERFGVGAGTAFLTALAQRDLVASQIAEVEAKVSLLKGLVDLYRLEGSLLERRGIIAPGH
ncbi:MAG: TolC family protein [Planctomycetes bacterium]|nr:TolC family protein [Planctomycetota bacterium]